MYHFCTIGSGNYLPFIETLFHSLHTQDENVVLHALLTDGTIPSRKNENLRFYSIDQLLDEPHVREIVDKYSYRNDYMRWALKPVLLLYLNKTYGKVIYVDNDIQILPVLQTFYIGLKIISCFGKCFFICSKIGLEQFIISI